MRPLSPVLLLPKGAGSAAAGAACACAALAIVTRCSARIARTRPSIFTETSAAVRSGSDRPSAASATKSTEGRSGRARQGASGRAREPPTRRRTAAGIRRRDAGAASSGLSMRQE